MRCGDKIVGQTKALLHHTDDSSGQKDLLPGANCIDGLTHPDPSAVNADPEICLDTGAETERQACGDRTKHKGLSKNDSSASASSKRQLADCEGSSKDTRSKKTGPVAWNSLTHVDCIGSPSGRCKRKKTTQLNEQRSQTLPHSVGCSAQGRPGRVSALSGPQRGGEEQSAPPGQPGPGERAPPSSGDGEIKAQLQAMETLISSSQETIKVLLGVIQELEKGEAQREGLSYRTGQDTANCDTCRNSACIIYSVELDFKQQEDKLQPLIKRLCPMDNPQYPALSYHQEVFTSTPKRKSKTESKKHGRWKLWFL